MFWNKKDNKRSLPDLPPYKRPVFLTQEMSGEESDGKNEKDAERHKLPSFPDFLNNKGFSQSAIKGAVGSDSEFEHIQSSPEREPERFSRESSADRLPERRFDRGPERGLEIESTESDDNQMEEWIPSMEKSSGGTKYTQEFKEDRGLGEPPSSSGFKESGTTGRKNADIFVKLDKFYSARKSLMDAQRKVGEINELLRKIRETKMREEQELTGWEKELMAIKSRINEIDINLFEKVD